MIIKPAESRKSEERGCGNGIINVLAEIITDDGGRVNNNINTVVRDDQTANSKYERRQGDSSGDSSKSRRRVAERGQQAKQGERDNDWLMARQTFSRLSSPITGAAPGLMAAASPSGRRRIKSHPHGAQFQSLLKKKKNRTFHSGLMIRTHRSADGGMAQNPLTGQGDKPAICRRRERLVSKQRGGVTSAPPGERSPKLHQDNTVAAPSQAHHNHPEGPRAAAPQRYPL